MTKLFNSIIVGPIHSRRLGSSLGINLLPQFGKVCNFDCIYCECGWNKDGRKDTRLPSVEQVRTALEERLKEVVSQGIKVDSITYSGNGEPTLHPQFPQIVDITVELRNKYYPDAVISLLSNATTIWKPAIREALKKIDNPILKIDSPIESYIDLINNPSSGYSLERVKSALLEMKGEFVLQTMFLKGSVEKDGKRFEVDCTAPENVEAWRNLVRELSPRKVMIYTIDRDTPDKELEKVSVEKMQEIASPLVAEGFDIYVAGA